MTDAMTSYAPSGSGYRSLVSGAYLPLDDFTKGELVFRPHLDLRACDEYPFIAEREEPINYFGKGSSYSVLLEIKTDLIDAITSVMKSSNGLKDNSLYQLLGKTVFLRTQPALIVL